MENKIKVNINGRMMGLDIPEVNIQFLNGEITIPGKSGGYVIASGCGSGKTTAIKDIIKQRFQEGVLYSASTIKECNEMYQYIKYEAELGSLRGWLNMNRVIVLHSNYNDEGVDNNLFNNDPEELMMKDIIICTHAKLLNNPPELLMRYKGNPVREDDLNLFRRASQVFNSEGICYAPRKWILVDELPTYKTKCYKITKSTIALLGKLKCDILWRQDGKFDQIPIVPVEYEGLSSFNLMRSMNEDLRVLNNIIPGTDKKSYFEKDLILSSIQENYNSMIKKDEINISYNITDLILSSSLSTRILLFEGTGDLTFYGSKVFDVITYNKKYNSLVELTKFSNNLVRHNKPSDNLEDIEEKLSKNVDNLYNIIKNSSGNGTLIVTWKNLKNEEFRVTGGTLNIKNEIFNEDFSLPEYYKSKLIERGLLYGYDIIHYQGGLDKSTNQYRDFENIVFLGEFHVPNSAVSDFNDRYKCDTNQELYTIYQLVQAICRTRIRNHRGESINVYFTDDWSDKIINGVNEYIGSDKINTPKVKITYEVFMEKFRPKWRSAIDVLCSIDGKLKSALESDRNYSMSIDLNIIYNLIPMSHKNVQKYYPLINYLKSLGIELTIKTSWSK